MYAVLDYTAILEFYIPNYLTMHSTMTSIKTCAKCFLTLDILIQNKTFFFFQFSFFFSPYFLWDRLAGHKPLIMIWTNGAAQMSKHLLNIVHNETCNRGIFLSGWWHEAVLFITDASC